MIHVDRSRVPAPDALDSPRVQLEREQAREYFRTPESRRESRRFLFRAYRHGEVRQALLELFRGKCSYCESVLEVFASADVEHFRPKTDTTDLEGDVFPDHYWWLATEWRNLYVACMQCNRTKRNRFPIAGPRAEPETPYEELHREEPELLDPCNDRPGKFLVFDERGRVASEERRGQITIELLALNRESLVQARRQQFERLKTVFDAWREDSTSAHRNSVVALAGPDAPYAGMARQFVLQWTGRRVVRDAFWHGRERLLDSLEDGHEAVAGTRRRRTVQAQRAYESSLEDFSLDEEPASQKLHILDQTIERIEIRNLRAIRDLVIEVSRSSETAPWTLLLGENGTGKSTVLQAIALTLAGADYRRKLIDRPERFVRRGCASGSIRLHLTGLEAPLELTFRARGPRSRRMVGSDERARLPVLGYGAIRLLPRHGALPGQDGTSFARVSNLFDPYVPLADASAWLLSLPDDGYRNATRSLRKLLGLSPRSAIRRNRRRQRIEVPSLFASSLIELSDGYQSVLAVAVDIMIVMTKHFRGMEAARGIVLLDEIGAHLHPRWRMSVIRSLRDAFPNVQFFVSTHDPLCLRGIEDGEVVVLKRDGRGRVWSVSDLPSVSGLRVDQLLTSEHFGLSSTVDPEFAEAFDRYYELLRKPKREVGEDDEFEELRGYLEARRVLGETRRERLMLEAIDRFIASETPEPEERVRQRESLDDELASLIDRVEV